VNEEWRISKMSDIKWEKKMLVDAQIVYPL